MKTSFFNRFIKPKSNVSLISKQDFSLNTNDVQIEIVHQVFNQGIRQILSTVVWLPELTVKEHLNISKLENPDSIVDVILKRERIPKKSVLSVNHFHSDQIVEDSVKPLVLIE